MLCICSAARRNLKCYQLLRYRFPNKVSDWLRKRMLKDAVSENKRFQKRLAGPNRFIEETVLISEKF